VALSACPSLKESTMKRAWRLEVLLILVMSVAGAFSLMISCGGGGGGGGNIPGPGPSQGVYLFYYDSNGGLYAVDPSNLQNPITVESNGIIDKPRMVVAGTWDAAAHEFKDIYVRYFVYIKGGRLYKVSALKSENFNKYQISSESDLSNLCESHIHYDFKDTENSRFVYRLKGSDNACGTADDVRKMIKIGMTAGDTPLVMPSYISVMKELIDRTDGSIIGWLTHNSSTSKLNRCDADIDNCYELPPNDNVQRAKHLGSDWSSTKEALWYYNGSDTWICIYDFSDDSIVMAFGFIGNKIHDHEKDSQAVYISYEVTAYHSITKITFDGTPQTLINYLTPPRDIALTDEMVVFISSDGEGDSIHSVKKDGTLITSNLATKQDINFLVPKGNKVFYFAQDASHFYAGAVRDDGTEAPYEVQDAIWGFFLFDPKVTNNDSNMPSIYRVVRIDGCQISTPYCANGTIKSFEPASYSSTATGINIGKVPSDIYFLGFELPFGVGKDIVGIGVNDIQVDVFYFMADEAGSLRRITNTPSVDEYPVLF